MELNFVIQDAQNIEHMLELLDHCVPTLQVRFPMITVEHFKECSIMYLYWKLFVRCSVRHGALLSYPLKMILCKSLLSLSSG